MKKIPFNQNTNLIDKLHAFNMLTKGKASPCDQMLIAQLLASGELCKDDEKCPSYVGRCLSLDLLIHREKMPKQKAYEIIAELENREISGIRKDYNQWERFDQNKKTRLIEKWSSGKNQYQKIAKREQEKNRVKSLNELIKNKT